MFDPSIKPSSGHGLLMSIVCSSVDQLQHRSVLMIEYPPPGPVKIHTLKILSEIAFNFQAPHLHHLTISYNILHLRSNARRHWRLQATCSWQKLGKSMAVRCCEKIFSARANYGCGSFARMWQLHLLTFQTLEKWCLAMPWNILVPREMAHLGFGWLRCQYFNI